MNPNNANQGNQNSGTPNRKPSTLLSSTSSLRTPGSKPLQSTRVTSNPVVGSFGGQRSLISSQSNLHAGTAQPMMMAGSGSLQRQPSSLLQSRPAQSLSSHPSSNHPYHSQYKISATGPASQQPSSNLLSQQSHPKPTSHQTQQQQQPEEELQQPLQLLPHQAPQQASQQQQSPSSDSSELAVSAANSLPSNLEHVSQYKISTNSEPSSNILPAITAASEVPDVLSDTSPSLLQSTSSNIPMPSATTTGPQPSQVTISPQETVPSIPSTGSVSSHSSVPSRASTTSNGRLLIQTSVPTPSPPPSVHSTAPQPSSKSPQQTLHPQSPNGSEEEDEDDDSSDEEETEPILRYQRLQIFKQPPPPSSTIDPEATFTSNRKKDAKFIDKKTLSTTFCHEKFLLGGTSTGHVIQYDLQGNETMRMHCHTSAVTCLSSDLAGDHIASASLDGTLIVTNVFTKEQSTIKFPSSILSLCLSPHFKTQQTVAVGLNNGQLIIASKGWLSYKNNVIHEGEGPVATIVWHAESGLLAWSTNKGIKVLDITRGERISFIVKPPNGFGDEVDATPHLIWARSDVLIIGWGNTVKVCQLRHRNVDSLVGHSSRASSAAKDVSGPAALGTKSSRFMQVITMFEVEDLIAGIAIVNEFIALLVCHYELLEPPQQPGAIDTQVNQKKPQYKMLPPELRLVTYTGEVQSSDALVLAGFGSTTYKQLRLVSLPSHDPLLYISNHSDMILAALVDLHEKIVWLYSHGYFLRGITLCTENFTLIQNAKKQWFIEVYLWNLLRKEQITMFAQEAIRLLPSIGLLNIEYNTSTALDNLEKNFESIFAGLSLTDREKLLNIIHIWEFWLHVFIHNNILNIIIPMLSNLLVIRDAATEANCVGNQMFKFPVPATPAGPHISNNKYTISNIIHRYMQHIFPHRVNNIVSPAAQKNNLNSMNTDAGKIDIEMVDLDSPVYEQHPLLPGDSYTLDPELLNHTTSLSETFFTQPVTFAEHLKQNPHTNHNKTLVQHCYDDESQFYRIVALPITPIQWRYQHRLQHQILSHNNINFQTVSVTPLVVHSHLFTTILLQLLKEGAINTVSSLIHKHPTTAYNTHSVIQSVYAVINKNEMKNDPPQQHGKMSANMGSISQHFVAVEHRITNIHIAFENLSYLTSSVNVDLIPLAYQNKEPTISQYSHQTNSAASKHPQHAHKGSNAQLTALYDILLHIFLQQKQYVEVVAVCVLTGNPLLFELITNAISDEHDNTGNIHALFPYIQQYILELAMLYPYQCINMLSLLYKISLKDNPEAATSTSQNPFEQQFATPRPPQITSNAPSEILSPAYIIEKFQLIPYLLYLYFSSLHKIEGISIAESSSSSTNYSSMQHSTSNRSYSQGVVNTYISKALPCYIHYAPDTELLHFLRTNTVYKLDTAVTLCHEYRRTSALVFLYVRTGNLRDAITLLLNPPKPRANQHPTIQNKTDGDAKFSILNNLKRAIEIVVESDEMSLWDIVFNYCLRDPNCLAYLLDYASMFLFAVNSTKNKAHAHADNPIKVDVIALLQKIPKNINLPNFTQILHTIVHNAYLHVTLTQTVYKSAQNDFSKQSVRYLREKRRGIAVNSEPIGLRRLLRANHTHDHTLNQKAAAMGMNPNLTQHLMPKTNPLSCLHCNQSILTKNDYNLTNPTLTLGPDGNFLPAPGIVVLPCCSSTVCATCAAPSQQSGERISCPKCIF